MKFTSILKEAVWLLLSEGRVSYRRLARDFDLDAAALEDLRFELIEVQCVAVDRDGQFLIWSPAAPTDGARRTLQPSHAIRSCEGPVSIDAVAPAATKTPASMIAPAAVEAEHAGASATVEPTVTDAERRPLTVMFCDLADSTALSTMLDPEDLQDVIRAYQECATEVIREYEGFVAKYMGDGILVYFGYPKSLERNAERAIHTALAIVDALGKRAPGRGTGTEIAVRIGVATGLVVVGEVVGEGLAQERTVIGEAPNMAARLQGLASRNGIVIGSLTKEIAGDVFAYEDLGTYELKGIMGSVQAWGVAGLRDDAAEADADWIENEDRATPRTLIGRDEETGLLRRAWQSTRDEGLGQVVTIAGEAGIGKSALVDSLRAEVRAQGLPQIAFRCSPYHTNSALYPLIEHVKRLLRWQPEDTDAARLAKLEAMVRGTALVFEEAVPLFASLLSLSLPEDRYRRLDLLPQQLRQQIQDVLITWTLEEAERRPMLEIWEDLHWADPSTLELLGLLIEQVPTASLLMVLTFRPDFQPSWPARSHITPLTVNRLERPHTEALVTRLAGDKPLPDEVIEHVVAKTDGVPLYVEELTKTILASDILRDAGERLELTGPLAALAIPETLQESLMARLDRLPLVREIAQLGSVLGREFAYEMISGLSTVAEATLRDGLGQLVDAELLYQRGRPPRARYFFKHALVQDAAYQSLLRRTRQQHHLKAAEMLEREFPAVAEAHPELVAHHYTEAGAPAEAFPFWRTAAMRAFGGWAMVEALGHLDAALGVLAALPEGQARDEWECEIQMRLGPATMATKGYAYPPLVGTYERALELCVRLDRPDDRIRVMRGQQLFHMAGGRLAKAMEVAEQLARLIEERGDPAFRVGAAHVLGQINFLRANFSTALRALEEGIAIYDPDRHQIANWPGGDPGEQCHLYAAFILWIQGQPERAIRHGDIAMDLANRRVNKVSLANTLAFVSLLRALNRDMDEARALADRGIALCQEQSNAMFLHWIRAVGNWARLESEDTRTCVDEMRDSIVELRKTGLAIWTPFLLAMEAEGLARMGEADDGLRLVEEALSMISSTGERCWEAELLRIKADLILAAADQRSDAAEDCYRAAIEIARKQDAKSWELRAATALARLWRDQGRHSEAHELLAPIHGWFTEGFDTRDLRDAKALLAELSVS